MPDIWLPFSLNTGRRSPPDVRPSMVSSCTLRARSVCDGTPSTHICYHARVRLHYYYTTTTYALPPHVPRCPLPPPPRPHLPARTFLTCLALPTTRVWTALHLHDCHIAYFAYLLPLRQHATFPLPRLPSCGPHCAARYHPLPPRWFTTHLPLHTLLLHLVPDWVG